MTRHRIRTVVTIAIAAITVFTTAAGGSFVGASATTTNARPPRTHKVAVRAHFEAPPDVLTVAPPCTLTDLIPVTGVCRATAFGEAIYTGDIQGTSAYEYGFVVDPAGASYFALLETITGTITGCGTGSITLRYTGTLDPAGHIDDTWQVVAGLGSGQLANVTGRGTGQGTYNPDATQSGNVRGQLRCGRS